MNTLENGIFTPQKWGCYQIADSSYQIADSSYHAITSKFSEKYIPAKKFVFSFLMAMMKKKTVFYLCYLFVINNIKTNRNKSGKQAAKTPSMSFFSKDRVLSCYLLSAICYLLSDSRCVFEGKCI